MAALLIGMFMPDALLRTGASVNTRSCYILCLLPAAGVLNAAHEQNARECKNLILL